MKKLTLLALCAFLIVLSLLMVSCGDSKTTTPTTTTVGGTTTAVTTKSTLSTAFDEPEKYVSIPNFDAISVNKSEINAEVDKFLNDVLSAMAEEVYTPTNEAAILGDSVNIFYTGTVKDSSVTVSESTMQGMTNASDEEGYDLVLGSNAFIPGFEEQLVGIKAGETVTIDVTFPTSYGTEELQGVEVSFEVKCVSVSRANKINEKSGVFVYVSYALAEGTTVSDDIQDFLEEREAYALLSDKESEFDTYFKVSDVYDALIGKSKYDTVTVELSLTAEEAHELGYNVAINLTATIVIDQIVTFHDKLTDKMVEEYTNGDYKTVSSFKDYAFEYYCQAFAYDQLKEVATYTDFFEGAYLPLYNGYYDEAIYNSIGDTSDYTEEELAELLTEDVKNNADEYATENATAEYKDRMLISLLCNKLDYSLTDEKYNEKLEELYEYYSEYYGIYLIYSGISSAEDLAEYFGVDNLKFQFTSEAVIIELAKLVTYVD